MAARTRKIRHDDETRLKIKTSQLINRLKDHALGKVELSSTQVRSIEILLKKTLPDLSAIDHSGEISTSKREMSDDELARIAARSSEGIAETESDTPITH